MKYLLIIIFLFLSVGIAKADYLRVDDGKPTIVSSVERNDFENITMSSVTAIISQLQTEGFNKWTRTEWLNEIYKRYNESYIEKRAREYPTTGDQLDAIWKILLNKEDSQSDAVKSKIEEVKNKYPKP